MGEPPDTGEPGTAPPPVSRPWRAAHVVALSALGVAGPALDVLGANPTFFVAHGAGPGQVALAGLAVVLVVPGLLIGLELAVSAVSDAAGWRAHLVIVGALATLVASALIDDLIAAVIDDLPQVSGPLALLLAVGTGVLFARAYAHRPLLRSTLSALVVAPLLFVAVFAFGSPAHDLLFPPSVAAASVSIEGVTPALSKISWA